MRKLTGGDLKELGLLKHYRIIRKWACKTNGITDADLELLIWIVSPDVATSTSGGIISGSRLIFIKVSISRKRESAIPCHACIECVRRYSLRAERRCALTCHPVEPASWESGRVDWTSESCSGHPCLRES